MYSWDMAMPQWKWLCLSCQQGEAAVSGSCDPRAADRRQETIQTSPFLGFSSQGEYGTLERVVSGDPSTLSVYRPYSH